MRYEEIDYGGEKLRIKVFDYHTPEGWREYVENTAGSVTDETFIAPADLPLAVEEGYLPQMLNALARFQAQMNGEGTISGLCDDNAVAEWITESRRLDESA